MGVLGREFRRVAGMLTARLPDLELHKLEDPRRRRGRRWRLPALLNASIVALAAGAQSLAEVESLTERMSRPLRRLLGLGRRLPDTSLRDVLVRLVVYEVRQRLTSFVRAAWRRKALALDGLPFHVVTMDGKATATGWWDDHYAQQSLRADGKTACGIIRTVTSCLVSTAARPIIDCFPVPTETNEMGAFPHAFESLLRSYGSLFQLVTYDAGAPSRENCRIVVDAGKDFFFRVKNENWLVFRDLQLLFEGMRFKDAWGATEDVLSNTKSVRRWVFVAAAPDSQHRWEAVKSLIRVHVRVIENGCTVSSDDRYYISSLEPQRLSGKQWLKVARSHWGVENNGHWTLDAIFREDEKPWIEAEPRAAVVIMVLRRIAYSMLALFRAVSLRSEENRRMPWKKLMHWVSDTLIAASEADIEGLVFSGAVTVFR